MNLGQQRQEQDGLGGIQVFKPSQGEMDYETIPALKNGVSTDDERDEESAGSLEIQSGASSLDIFEFLNTPYLKQLAVPEEVLEWIVHNRARKIQWAFMERLHKTVTAVRYIQAHWRRYQRLRQSVEFRKAMVENTRKKAAIRKISMAYRQMKVNKVFNAQMIMQEKGILIPQLYNKTHVYSALVI